MRLSKKVLSVSLLFSLLASPIYLVGNGLHYQVSAEAITKTPHELHGSWSSDNENLEIVISYGFVDLIDEDKQSINYEIVHTEKDDIDEISTEFKLYESEKETPTFIFVRNNETLVMTDRQTGIEYQAIDVEFGKYDIKEVTKTPNELHGSWSVDDETLNFYISYGMVDLLNESGTYDHHEIARSEIITINDQKTEYHLYEDQSENPILVLVRENGSLSITNKKTGEIYKAIPLDQVLDPVDSQTSNSLEATSTNSEQVTSISEISTNELADTTVSTTTTLQTEVITSEIKVQTTNKDNLPKTGESNRWSLIVGAVVLLLGGGFLILKKRK